MHCHIFFNCERDIWIVMVVEKGKEGDEEVRVAALEAMLKKAHDLFVMFFGSIRGLLQKQPVGGLAARSGLHAFSPDYFAGSWGPDSRGAKAHGSYIWATYHRANAIVYKQCRAVTLIMLIPTNSSVSGLDGLSLLRGQLCEKGAQKIQKLEGRFSSEWKGINASHVPGYRYLCCDRASKTAKAAPSSKVATLSKTFTWKKEGPRERFLSIIRT